MINFFMALWDNIKFLFIPLLIITPIAFLGGLLELWIGFPYIIYLLIVLVGTLIVISIIDAKDKTKMIQRGVLYKQIEDLEAKALDLKEKVLDTDDSMEREKIYTELHETLTIINEMRSRLENM